MKLRGSGLVEYTIPLGLVGLVVGIGIYSFANSGSLLNMILGSTHGKFDAAKGSISINQKSNVAPLSNPNSSNPGTNPNTPNPESNPTHPPEASLVSQCSSGTCSIDFGSLTLTGIPENFSEFVKSNSSSGGTDRLSDMFMQISDQLAAQGDVTGASQYKDLANLGHFLAKEQVLSETMADNILKKYGTNPMLSQILMEIQGYQELQPLTVPSNVSHLITNYKGHVFDDYDLLSDEDFYVTSISLNQVQHYYKYKNITPNAYPEVFQSYPTSAMVAIYNSVMENPNYSSDLKGITTALVKSIDDLNFNLQQNITSSLLTTGEDLSNQPDFEQLATYLDPKNTKRFDLVSGNQIDNNYTLPSSGTTLVNLNTSPFTHLDSRLICAVGKGDDVNNACQKD